MFVSKDRAYPFVNNETVMFGFQDILFHPDDAIRCLLVHLNESRSDIVLGLFPEWKAGRLIWST
jgi:hypothetical protein